MTSFLDSGESIGGFATAIAVLVGGFWTWKHFIARADLSTKIELDVDLNFLGCELDAEQILVEVRCTVKNCGQVRHTMKDLAYSLRTLNVGDPVVPVFQRASSDGKKTVDLLGQIDFKHPVTTPTRFFPRSWGHSFVDPGVTTVYSSITAITAHARLVRVAARLPYAWASDCLEQPDDDFHSTQRVFRVPPDGITASQNR